mmetsp:Transcript_44341/g.109217  ORF Transcript_44341/g.109217 Transcript_44341/m.109217 type:complete len:89 (-) Transcript_44341:16-282(-)
MQSGACEPPHEFSGVSPGFSRLRIAACCEESVLDSFLSRGGWPRGARSPGACASGVLGFCHGDAGVKFCNNVGLGEVASGRAIRREIN